MGLLQEELHRVAQNWNLHRIRCSNGETPAGKPDVRFFIPEELDAINQKIDADDNDVDVAENLCANRNHPRGCSSSFVQLAELIMEDNHLQMPRNIDEAMFLYLQLIYHINDL